MNKRLNDLRAMGKDEAALKLKELRNALAKEQAVKSTNTRPENPGKARTIRVQIARILTIQKEKGMKTPSSGNEVKT
ncbi:MAG: 50S ribosomal protein L29 [Candidatus Diapherotrites archaeon]|nr:50S ribosomal protein L29 [Candidatus Diapherotrites archaeon]MDZ4256385.1 50S ribosomal protein L29 [archaeon]